MINDRPIMTYKDKMLHDKIKAFVFSSFSVIKKDLDGVYDLRKSILYDHVNFFYHSLLSHFKPEFFRLTLFHRQKLEKLPDFVNCVEFMKHHAIVSKFIFIAIGTKCDYNTRWPSNYLFSMLETLSEIYFIKNITTRSMMSEIQLEENFEQIYSDYEFIFYNRKIPVKELIPLLNFSFTGMDEIPLDNTMRITKISNQDIRTISDIHSIESDKVIDIIHSPIVIEFTAWEKIIDSKTNLDPNFQYQADLYSPITLLRLFKKGLLTYSQTFHLKQSYSPFDICKSEIVSPYRLREQAYDYSLNDAEISDFLHFWREYKGTLLEILSNENKWSNVKLSLDRFNSSYYRPNDPDRFIDLSIAIEALFSKEDDISGSLTHKYSLRLSRLLGSKLNDYEKYYGHMKELYGIRSKIVHGNRKTKDLGSKTDLLENYVRESLKEYLSRVKNSKTHDEIIYEIDYL